VCWILSVLIVALHTVTPASSATCPTLLLSDELQLMVCRPTGSATAWMRLYALTNAEEVLMVNGGGKCMGSRMGHLVWLRPCADHSQGP
jgi:hypothetical protein